MEVGDRGIGEVVKGGGRGRNGVVDREEGKERGEEVEGGNTEREMVDRGKGGSGE